MNKNQILCTFTQFQNTLSLIKPIKIAVAYVGIDYHEFIDTSDLKEIIVSPTVGTNPYALTKIIKNIGWENVHFLNKLHSKIYIGDDAAIIGSANLSRHALGVNGLYEAGVVINDENSLKRLKELFELYKIKAKNNYPTEKDKSSALQELYKSFNKLKHKLRMHGESSNKRNKNFSEYDYSIDQRFKISWYFPYIRKKDEYNTSAFTKNFLGQTWNEIYNNINNEFDCAKKVNIENGEWLLTYRINEKKIVQKSGLEWMYVDNIIKNGFKDSDYPNCLIELISSKKNKPPFTINKQFRDAFVQVINKPKYKVFRNINNIYLVSKTSHYNSLWKDVKGMMK
jgi:hypothetical protein